MNGSLWKGPRGLEGWLQRGAQFGIAVAILLCASLLKGQAQRSAASEPWMAEPPVSTGIAAGQKIPAFQLRDQFGKLQDFSSVSGPKGAAIYFIRSADW